MGGAFKVFVFVFNCSGQFYSLLFLTGNFDEFFYSFEHVSYFIVPAHYFYYPRHMWVRFYNFAFTCWLLLMVVVSCIYCDFGFIYVLW